VKNLGEESINRLFVEPVLSEILRSLLSLRMTKAEGPRMTGSEGLRVAIYYPSPLTISGRSSAVIVT